VRFGWWLCARWRHTRVLRGRHSKLEHRPRHLATLLERAESRRVYLTPVAVLEVALIQSRHVFSELVASRSSRVFHTASAEGTAICFVPRLEEGATWSAVSGNHVTEVGCRVLGTTSVRVIADAILLPSGVLARPIVVGAASQAESLRIRAGRQFDVYRGPSERARLGCFGDWWGFWVGSVITNELEGGSSNLELAACDSARAKGRTRLTRVQDVMHRCQAGVEALRPVRLIAQGDGSGPNIGGRGRNVRQVNQAIDCTRLCAGTPGKSAGVGRVSDLSRMKAPGPPFQLALQMRSGVPSRSLPGTNTPRLHAKAACSLVAVSSRPMSPSSWPLHAIVSRLAAAVASDRAIPANPIVIEDCLGLSVCCVSISPFLTVVESGLAGALSERCCWAREQSRRIPVILVYGSTTARLVRRDQIDALSGSDPRFVQRVDQLARLWRFDCDGADVDAS